MKQDSDSVNAVLIDTTNELTELEARYAALETRVKELETERDRLEKAYGILYEWMLGLKQPRVRPWLASEAHQAVARAEAARKGE